MAEEISLKVLNLKITEAKDNLIALNDAEGEEDNHDIELSLVWGRCYRCVPLTSRN